MSSENAVAALLSSRVFRDGLVSDSGLVSWHMKHNDQSVSVGGLAEVDRAASAPRGSTSLKLFDIVLEMENDKVV